MNSRQNLYLDLLREHIIEPWFPRCIDAEHEGFLSGFDTSWRAVGNQEKQLEFQARQTTAAAELLLCFPQEESLRRAVEAGWSYLREASWDQDSGGWFAMTDRAGRALLDGQKHAHGIAYAIQACFAVFAAGQDEAKAFGEEGIRWLDHHAYDAESGSYWGPLTRGGTVITQGKDNSELDLIGTPFGLKDMNVNKDMFAALSSATRLTHDTLVRARFEDTFEFLLRYYGRHDFPVFFIKRNGEPYSDFWKPSESAQAVGNLIEAQSIASQPDELLSVAKRLLFRSFREGWNSRIGGLIYARQAGSKPDAAQLADVQWWPQFELLKAAAYFEHLEPDNKEVARIKHLAWDAIERIFQDKRHRGFYATAVAGLSPRDRLFRTRSWRQARRKGDGWKDASHEARAMIRLLQIETAVKGELPHRIEDRLY